MCQARMSLHLTSVLTWSLLGSLTFGFCSIWSLHFVAMLACELDLRIGIDVGLTVLSALLAVTFTFAALGSDMLMESYRRGRKRQRRKAKKRSPSVASGRLTPNGRMHSNDTMVPQSSVPLLGPLSMDDEETGNGHKRGPESRSDRPPLLKLRSSERSIDRMLKKFHKSPQIMSPAEDTMESPGGTRISYFDRQDVASPIVNGTVHTPEPEYAPRESTEALLPESTDAESSTSLSESNNRSSSDLSSSRRSSSLFGSSSSSHGLGSLMNMAYRTSVPAKNAFIATAEALYYGFTYKNITRGFVWSLAITSMHYVGIVALEVPNGHITLNPVFVILSAFISWVVCIIGAILMVAMEAHISQQLLFSVVGTTGVAAMHFTGMRATTFWSSDPPSEVRGYPKALPTAIVSIAITTCILANGLLAHAATVSRNKLAEIVWTRRKLWRTIAQKENAEQAAAARSDFIASASHEIRTPLHHLQGYSDLLSRTELSEEGRILLYAIQRATKTLSLITNNVLDWSKLERDKDALCRPVALDMRSVCESILVLLPNKDDDAEVEVMVVIKPGVPKSLFLDETYIHRILMNLLSNALKFTCSGYVMLSLEMSEDKLVCKVLDSGIGVPPSFLPQLFEPFKQAQTRGSQRGTGLGLSIVKQLLHKMQGTIEVQSRHAEIEDVGPDQTGSTFTITVPTQVSSPTIVQGVPTIIEAPTVAIFDTGKDLCMDGWKMAWEHFEHNVIVVNNMTELNGVDFKYIFADAAFLDRNQEILHQLIKHDDWTILVPYDTQNSLQRLPGMLSAPQFVPLQKPLQWHTFASRVAIASQAPNKQTLSRSVRFASKVDILDGQNKEQPREASTSKNVIVLLVEDNPVSLPLPRLSCDLYVLANTCYRSTRSSATKCSHL